MSSQSLRRAAALRHTLRRNARASFRMTSAPVSELGCSVVRRFTDDEGATWTVREAYVGGFTGGATLVFDDTANRSGIEIRRAPRTLAHLDDGDLLQLLRSDY